MNSPAQALFWSIWRRYRWGLSVNFKNFSGSSLECGARPRFLNLEFVSYPPLTHSPLMHPYGDKSLRSLLPP